MRYSKELFWQVFFGALSIVACFIAAPFILALGIYLVLRDLFKCAQYALRKKLGVK